MESLFFYMMVTIFTKCRLALVAYFSLVMVNAAQNVRETGKFAPVPSNGVGESEPGPVPEYLHRKIFDDEIGSQDPFSAVDRIKDSARPPDSIAVNKCCPWGTFFDVDTLICKRTPGPAKSDHLTEPESWEMRKKFVTSHIREHKDVNEYEFVTGVPFCNGTKVFVSQVTTYFTCGLDGAKLEGQPIANEYCIDGRSGPGTVLLTCQDEKEACRSRPCIRKCKPYGEFFGMEDEGILELPPMAVEFYNLNTMKIDGLAKLSDFGIYFGNNCGGRGRLKLSPEEDPTDVHYLGTDGRLYLPDHDKSYYANDEFCLEFLKEEDISQVCVFLCFPKPVSNLKFYLLACCFLISCVSLLATFLVYLFSPRSQNLCGKSLMCYVASLFSAYLSFAVIQLGTNEMEKDGCIVAGFSALFFFLAAFFWLNIMSIDIWNTFRSVRLARFNNSKEEKIRFMWYSLYSWSLPCILTGLCAAADFVPGFVPLSIKPNFGQQTCWFSKLTKAVYVFFITPISLVIICNTILYVSTAWRCWKIKSEIIRMGNQSRKKYTANKTQLAINGKLFIVMGVVWSLEVISFFFDHPIWYISDAANALHGVFIFVIFVLKKKVPAGLPQGIKKPFIRMKNIKKKSTDETGDFDDTNASKKFSRSSSTNVTDVSM